VERRKRYSRNFQRAARQPPNTLLSEKEANPKVYFRKPGAACPY